MRFENGIFEKRPPAFKKMKRFTSALFLLFFCILGAAAQSTTIVQPTVSPTIATMVIKSVTAAPNQIDQTKPLTLAEAVDLALKQASNFKASQINEQIAAQDIRQAKAALYPRVAANPTLIYTSPSLSRTTTVEVTNGNIAAVSLRPPSFLGANAITEYQAIINAAGEIDISGRLRATIKRNRIAASGGSRRNEVARRDLANAVSDAYFNFALATLLGGRRKCSRTAAGI